MPGDLIVGQGPTVLAVGTGGFFFFHFFFFRLFFPFSLLLSGRRQKLIKILSQRAINPTKKQPTNCQDEVKVPYVCPVRESGDYGCSLSPYTL